MKKSKIISICILAVVFVTVLVLGLTGTTTELELAVHKLLNPNAEIGEFFHSFTVLGDTILDVVLIAILLFLPLTTKKVGIPVASTAIVSTVLNKVIKAIVKRARPELMLLQVSGYSFPSGHAMNNAAIYIGMMFCLLPLCKVKWQKAIVIAIFTIMPFIIGLSRVYFNVHYLSDVVCGWCLGGIVAIVMSEFFKEKQGKI